MDNLTDIRSALLDTMTQIESKGLFMRLYGSVSQRIDSDFFYMAGGDLRPCPAKQDDIRRVSIRKESRDQNPGKGRHAPDDAVIHAAIYRARADVNVVVMCRQCFASALGLVLPDGISAEDESGNILKIRTVPFAIPGSDAQRSHVRRLAAREDSASALVAVGGGVFSYGGTMKEALYTAGALEDYAKLYLSEIGKTSLSCQIVDGFSSERSPEGIRYHRTDTPQRVRLIHEKIYALRPDVREIFHNVSEAARTVSRICQSLPVYYDDFARLVGGSVTVPGNCMNDPRRGEVLVGKKINASIIHDDGAFCYGTDDVPAALTALSVEKACIAQIAAVRMGGAVTISRRDIRRLKRSML